MQGIGADSVPRGQNTQKILPRVLVSVTSAETNITTPVAGEIASLCKGAISNDIEILWMRERRGGRSGRLRLTDRLVLLIQTTFLFVIKHLLNAFNYFIWPIQRANDLINSFHVGEAW